MPSIGKKKFEKPHKYMLRVSASGQRNNRGTMLKFGRI
jgi:hypothetical protein